KQFRRVATRYDKLLVNFMGFVKLAAIAIWLRQLNRHYGLDQFQRDRAAVLHLELRQNKDLEHFR
ncbi:hypothetical protein QOZ94_002752, partial [Xanthobacter agilis]|nr:hypothetical protein [Xanthobacter agilis]